MKATHTGTCQVCLRNQKLPSGVLSKHGYTTKFGYYEGVCRGAGHLPLEQDRTILDREAEALTQWASDLESKPAPAVNCHFGDVYVSSTWGRRGYNIPCMVANDLSAYKAKILELFESGKLPGRTGFYVSPSNQYFDTSVAQSFESAQRSAEYRKEEKIRGARLHVKSMYEAAQTIHGASLVPVK